MCSCERKGGKGQLRRPRTKTERTKRNSHLTANHRLFLVLVLVLLVLLLFILSLLLSLRSPPPFSHDDAAKDGLRLAGS